MPKLAGFYQEVKGHAAFSLILSFWSHVTLVTVSWSRLTLVTISSRFLFNNEAKR